MARKTKEVTVTAPAADPPTDPFHRPTGESGMPLCMDGCGKEVGKVTTRFIAGHDSKLKSLIVKVSRGQEPYEAIPEIGRDYANDILSKLPPAPAPAAAEAVA